MNAPVTFNEVATMQEPTFGQELQHYSADAEGIKQVALSYTVDSQEMYELAGQELAAIKAKRKAITDQQDSMLEPFKEAKRKIEEGRRKIVDFFSRPLAALGEADHILTRACAGHLEDQERKRRAAEEKAREEQRKLQEAAEKKAEKLEAKGQGAKAAEVRAAVPIVSVPVVAPMPGKIAGVTMRSNWKAKVTNKLALIKFVAANPQYIEVLDENQTALNRMAVSLKGAMQIDGVEARDEKVSARA